MGVQKFIIANIVVGMILYTPVFAQSTSYIDTSFTQYFRRTAGWTAGDATISLALPDGRSLWCFGDSYLDNVTTINRQQMLPCLFQVRNAVMIQSGKNFLTLLDTSKIGLARTFFKVSDQVANDPIIWPDKGFIYKDTAYIFLSRLNQALEYLDGYLAKMTLPSLKVSSLSRIPSVPAGINFGVSILKNIKGDSLYVYGVKAGFLSFDAYLARCPIDQVMGKWDFYTGSGWSATFGEIKKLTGTNFTVSPQYSVFPYKGKYYLVTQENGFLTCNLGRNIYGYQASSPFGPFTNRQLLYTVVDTLKGNFMRTYNAEVHLQFADSCSFLLSYNVNGGCTSTCNGLIGSIPADSYRPKFVRVPWNLLDPLLKCSIVPTTQEIKDQELFTLFPNPSSGHFILQAKSIHHPVSIQIITIHGQVILNQSYPAQTAPFEFDLKDPGIFLLRIKTGDHTISKMIMAFHG